METVSFYFIYISIFVNNYTVYQRMYISLSISHPGQGLVRLLRFNWFFQVYTVNSLKLNMWLRN